MRTRALIGVVVLVGCGAPAREGRPPLAPVAEPPRVAETAPDLYGGLFVEGATFTYDVTTVHDEPPPDENGERIHEESTETATCRVTEVTRDGATATSTIECEGEGFDGVAGTWFTDGRGLWLAGGDDDGAAASLDDVFLLARPVASHVETGDPDDETSAGFDEIAETAHGWCRTSAVTYGDEAWQTVCFRDGAIAYVEDGSCGYACYEHHVTLRER